jgi:probable HAF family extracellular repeat protein
MIHYRNWRRAFALAALMPAVAQAQSYQLLGFLPGGLPPSHAYDLSSDGAVVVGFARDPIYGGTRQPFRWTQQSGIVGLGPRVSQLLGEESIKVSGDGTTILFPPGLTLYTASGAVPITGWFPENLSYDGSVLVGVRSDAQLRGKATLWSQSTGFVDLGFLLDATWSTSVARDVSADGSVVIGYSTYEESAAVTGFRWTADGGMINLGFGATQLSADGSTVAGTRGGNSEVVRWTEAHGVQGLGVNGIPWGVSGDGSRIVGVATVPLGDGSISYPFIWDAHNGVQNLVDVFTNQYGLGASIAEWVPVEVSGISDDGQSLIGTAAQYGPVNTRFQAWAATIPPLPAVPEPNAATLVCALAASLPLIRRR